MRNASATGRHPSYRTNTRMSFPDGAGYYSEGEIPEFAYVGEGRGRGVDVEAEPFIVYSLENIPADVMRDYGGQFQERRDLPFTNFGAHGDVLFGTTSQAEYFKDVGAEERRVFLFQLANQAITRQLSFMEMENVIRILSDPRAMGQHSAADIDAALQSVHRVYDTMDFLACSTSSIALGSGCNGAGEDRVRAMFGTRNPLLRTIFQKLKGLRERVVKRPLEFVLFVNALSHEKRMAFLQLVKILDEDDYVYHVYRYSASIALSSALSDSRLIGIGERPGYAPGGYLEVELVDAPPTSAALSAATVPKTRHSPVAVRGEKTRRGQSGRHDAKKDDSFVDDSLAVDRISPECATDLILELSGRTELYRRFSPALSRVFMRLNRDGRYDDAFMRSYRGIAEVRPGRTKTIPDPYVDPHMKNSNAVTSGGGTMHIERTLLPHDIAQILRDIDKRRAVYQTREIEVR